MYVFSSKPWLQFIRKSVDLKKIQLFELMQSIKPAGKNSHRHINSQYMATESFTMSELNSIELPRSSVKIHVGNTM